MAFSQAGIDSSYWIGNAFMLSSYLKLHSMDALARRQVKSLWRVSSTCRNPDTGVQVRAEKIRIGVKEDCTSQETRTYGILQTQ